MGTSDKKHLRVDQIAPTSLDVRACQAGESGDTATRDRLSHAAKTAGSLLTYAESCGTSNQEAEWAITDLLIGLEHLCDEHGLDFTALAAAARDFAADARLPGH